MSNDERAPKTADAPAPSERGNSAIWIALHREDGTEVKAPGYFRVPLGEWGARFPKAPSDWGEVSYASGWNAPVSGRRVTHLQPILPEWLS